MNELVEYLTQDGERWRVESGGALLALFGMERAAADGALPKWHAVLSAEKTTWWVICRLYAVNPLVGVDDPDEVRPWTEEEVAERLGARRGERADAGYVRELVALAVEHWRKYGLKTTPAPTEAFEGPAPRTDGEDELLLKRYGFRNVIDPDERAYILERLEVFEPYLQSGQAKAMALSAIQQEVDLFFSLEPSIQLTRRQIRDLEEGKNSKLQKRRQEMLSSLKETMEALGMTEEMNPSLSKKLAFKDAISEIIRAVQEYKSNGENTLIDGMFTAAEVKILVTPVELRPPQYRPDLVISGVEALQNLFNKDWTPTPIQRAMHRKLLSAFQRALIATHEDSETPVDPVFGADAAQDEPAGIDEAQPDEAGMPHAPMPGNGPQLALPEQGAPSPRTAREAFAGFSM